MLFYPSAPAAARDVVLRVRQASRAAARRPGGSGRSQAEPGRSRPAVTRPAAVPPANSGPDAPHPRAAARRALRRRLAQASARIEKGRDYQRSLAQLAELAAALQEGLSPAQRSCWLTLEEAVLEHTARLNRAYFHAGAEAAAMDGRISRWLGHRYSAGQPSAMSPCPPAPPHSALPPSPAAAPPVNSLPLDAGTLDSVTLEAVAVQAMTLHAMAADSIAADARLLAALAELVERLRRLSR